MMYTPAQDEPDMKTEGEASAGTMTNRLGNQEPRRIACSACGAELTCTLSGTCWCAQEPARLPMPVAGEDCLCRNCLRKIADEALHKAAG